MILVLSGEGKTDLGQNDPTPTGLRYRPGAMALIVDQLVVELTGDSPRFDQEYADEARACFIGEGQLSRFKPPKGQAKFFRGRKSHLHAPMARLLGYAAQKVEHETGETTVAVFFRDCDGTQSSSRTEWQDKFDSIKAGFRLAGYSSGVPMLPKPKSEAWLLCALKDPAYQHCGALEDASGNDASPNSLKKRLQSVLESRTQEDVENLVREGKIRGLSIDMPSFRAFQTELETKVVSAVAKEKGNR